MPNYKVLGILSFADNVKKMSINDPVILRKESFNVISKNAIAVYSIDNKKLGYLPSENELEITDFKNAYKISNLVINKFPILEINRFYPQINVIDNIEYPFEKKIKYDYILVNISNELKNNIICLEKFLKKKNITVKRTAIIYTDVNFINILIETTKGIKKFETITLKYFKDNIDRYEELYENGFINNTFYKNLFFYRLECYYESNYLSILEYPLITNKFLLNYIQNIVEEKVHDRLEIYNNKEIEMYINNTFEIHDNKINIILVVKLYLRYLLNGDAYFLLKYLNLFFVVKYIEVKDVLNQIITNYKVLEDVMINYGCKLGNFAYDHKLKIHNYIDFINNDTVFVIAKEFNINHIYNNYLSNKENLVIYNPIEGKIFKISSINLKYFN